MPFGAETRDDGATLRGYLRAATDALPMRARLATSSILPPA